MVPIRWPHSVKWAIANNAAECKFACTIAQRAVFPRTSESTHRNSIPATKTLKIALTVIGCTGFRIADGITELHKGGGYIHSIGVEYRCVENVI